MTNLALNVKEVEFNGDKWEKVGVNQTGEIYVRVSEIGEDIGLSVDQIKRQYKNLQKDPLLKHSLIKLPTETNGGIQEVYHINVNAVGVWLSGVNRNSLSECQYYNLIKIINYVTNSDFSKLKLPSNEYEWEGQLRDDIFSLGFFNDYELIGKEKQYNFGRVDIIARDKNGKNIFIELKKKKNYNNVIQQCLDYQLNFRKYYNEDVKIVICTLDNDESFLEEAKFYDFEVYKYKREIKLERII